MNPGQILPHLMRYVAKRDHMSMPYCLAKNLISIIDIYCIYVIYIWPILVAMALLSLLPQGIS